MAKTTGKFKVEGLKDLNQALKKLDTATGMRAMSAASRFAMTPAVKDARKSAPVGSVGHKTYKGRHVSPGFLSRNIRLRTKRWKNKEGVTSKIGMHKEAFYGKFSEFGKDILHKQQAKPWLGPVMDRQAETIISRFRIKLARGIEKALKK